MTTYRAVVTKTLGMHLEFDDDELEEVGLAGDPNEFAWRLAQDLPSGDWEIEDTYVDVEEF